MERQKRNSLEPKKKEKIEFGKETKKKREEEITDCQETDTFIHIINLS